MCFLYISRDLSFFWIFFYMITFNYALFGNLVFPPFLTCCIITFKPVRLDPMLDQQLFFFFQRRKNKRDGSFLINYSIRVFVLWSFDNYNLCLVFFYSHFPKCCVLGLLTIDVLHNYWFFLKRLTPSFFRCDFYSSIKIRTWFFLHNVLLSSDLFQTRQAIKV